MGILGNLFRTKRSENDSKIRTVDLKGWLRVLNPLLNNPSIDEYEDSLSKLSAAENKRDSNARKNAVSPEKRNPAQSAKFRKPSGSKPG